MRSRLFSRRQALVAPAIAAAAAASVDAAPTTPSHRLVASDTLWTHDLQLGNGDGFAVARGATLTLHGDFAAPARRVFFGEGRVDLSRSRILFVRPEWWGAVPDDPAVDCQPAIAAALAAHPVVLLGPGDYRLSKTLVISATNRRLGGIGRTKDARGSRLVLDGGEGAVVLLGATESPGGINDYPRGLELRSIGLGRTVPPASSSAVGLEIRHVLDTVCEGVWSDEHASAYRIARAVRTTLRDCSAFRSARAGAGGDRWTGFELGGEPNGSAGANASLYLYDCVARTGGDVGLAQSTGLAISGAIADVFAVRFETTSLTHGIVVDGSAIGRADPRAAHVDVQIESPVLDGCGVVGLSLAHLSAWAAVEVTRPYIALAAEGATALQLTDVGGTVGVDGGQLIGWPARAAGRVPTGIAVSDASGFAITGTKLVGFATPMRIERARAFSIAVQINSRILGAASAVALIDCSHGLLAPVVTGDARVHAAGVSLEGRCGAITVETAGIDSRAVGIPVAQGGRPVAPLAGRVFVGPLA